MARNVEIKARVENLETMRQLVAGVADGEPEILTQLDTYFKVKTGRLKLRELTATEAELIYYVRPDAYSPAESRYRRIRITNPQELGELLAGALGTCGEVRKRRLVYRVGRTRVHLDEVRDLGCFLELEVELGEEDSTDAGIAEAQRLMDLLGISQDALVADAYIDLVQAAAAQNPQEADDQFDEQ